MSCEQVRTHSLSDKDTHTHSHTHLFFCLHYNKTRKEGRLILTLEQEIVCYVWSRDTDRIPKLLLSPNPLFFSFSGRTSKLWENEAGTDRVADWLFFADKISVRNILRHSRFLITFYQRRKKWANGGWSRGDDDDYESFLLGQERRRRRRITFILAYPVCSEWCLGRILLTTRRERRRCEIWES